MNKLIVFSFIGASLMLAACAPVNHAVDYGYESQAPYSAARTAGAETARADTVFVDRQRK